MFITFRITAWNFARWPRPRFNISISSLSRTYLKGMTAFRNGGTPPAGKRAACLRPHKRGNHCYSGQRRSETRTDLYHSSPPYIILFKSSFFSVRQTNTDNALKYLNAAFQIFTLSPMTSSKLPLSKLLAMKISFKFLPNAIQQLLSKKVFLEQLIEKIETESIKLMLKWNNNRIFTKISFWKI